MIKDVIMREMAKNRLDADALPGCFDKKSRPVVTLSAMVSSQDFFRTIAVWGCSGPRALSRIASARSKSGPRRRRSRRTVAAGNHTVKHDR
jgi:hypothetical protein